MWANHIRLLQLPNHSCLLFFSRACKTGWTCCQRSRDEIKAVRPVLQSLLLPGGDNSFFFFSSHPVCPTKGGGTLSLSLFQHSNQTWWQTGPRGQFSPTHKGVEKKQNTHTHSFINTHSHTQACNHCEPAGSNIWFEVMEIDEREACNPVRVTRAPLKWVPVAVRLRLRGGGTAKWICRRFAQPNEHGALSEGAAGCERVHLAKPIRIYEAMKCRGALLISTTDVGPPKTESRIDAGDVSFLPSL